MAVLAISSDNVVTLTGLFDSISVTYQNGATVTGVVLDSWETVVPNTAFAMPYLGGTNGNYQGVITNAMAALLAEGQPYYVQVTAAVGPVQVVFREEYTADYVS